MNRALAFLAVSALLVTTSGCSLCFLPCTICLDVLSIGLRAEPENNEVRAEQALLADEDDGTNGSMSN